MPWPGGDVVGVADGTAGDAAQGRGGETAEVAR